MGVDLHIVPIDWSEACAFVNKAHRHHKAPRGHKFSIGVTVGSDRLVGVAIVGRPVARYFDNRFTAEVTRVATDGTRNACSKLYGAAWNAWKERGGQRLVTYTQDGESGASLKGAGWLKLAERRPRAGWNMPSRPREDRGADNIARILWEIKKRDAPVIDIPALIAGLRDETRYETPQCPVCHGPLPSAATGRPPVYCGAACKQRAYRARRTQPASA